MTTDTTTTARTADRAAAFAPEQMRQFTGSEHWYRHALVRNILFTDGAHYVAEKGGAFWLLDEIALAQRFDKDVARQEFQVWKLAVQPDRSATAKTANTGPSSRRRSPGPTSRSSPSSSGLSTTRSICRASADPPYCRDAAASTHASRGASSRDFLSPARRSTYDQS